MRATIVLLLICLIPAHAEILPGHSYHGEAFNEGPRQAARLMGGTGPINFEVTVKGDEARSFFNQGVGQLHGFWYFEAERSFRQVAQFDPDCAMAYWGMAMANGNNKKRARDFIKQASKGGHKVTARERRYISALAKYLRDDKRKSKERYGDYADDLKEIMEDYPDDIEAKAFYALQLWKNKRYIKIKDHQVPNKILNEVLAKQPLHPVHHYRIHLWDITPGATNALNSAARAGKAASSIAHMWHMPGHTYSRLKRYSDGAWQQEASARTDHAYMIRNRVMPDQIHNFAHNNEWLIRNLNHLGAVDRAMDLARNMIELPRHPKYNSFKKGSANYGTIRLLETLVRYELWEELIRLSHTQYFAPTDNNDHEVRRVHALGLAYAWKGDIKKADAQLVALNNLKAKRPKPKKPEPKKSSSKDSDKDDQKSSSTKKKPAPKKKAPRVGFLGTMSTIELAEAEIRAIKASSYADATAARDWMHKASKLPPERLSLIHAAIGDEDKAIELAKSSATKNVKQLQPAANLARMHWKFGREKEAIAEFKKLRLLTAETDIRAPIFASLAPIAKKAGFKSDWRPTLQRAKDFGERPSLDSLGPFRWTPSSAADWTLPNEKKQQLSMKDHLGRATIVIFYLGEGCTHCIEQLAAFAPLTEEFKDLGISLVGISTDSIPGLSKSAKKAKEDGGFPFPLVADPKLDVFKRYRAYDDFEKTPLHGTFLVSPRGNVLWQDISYEPFVKTDFLLKEAERLLGLADRTNFVGTAK